MWRFLVANEGHLAKAKEQLVRDIAWREETHLLDLQGQSRTQVTGVDDDFFVRQYRCLFLGYEDAAHNFSPVCYRSLTHLQTWVIVERGATVEKMIRHELWQYEHDCHLLFAHPESFPARQLKIIIDISDMTWSQCTKDIISILSGFSSFSKLHHPERLNKLFIVGAPRPFAFVWSKLIVHLIPASTREKIAITADYKGHPWLEAWMAKVVPPANTSTT